eukprot:CAMPEP_0204068488 /NCGR_PEP_ID=MMETSP0360-20130528/155374_1 /ASSEMBLY_ACC=CAM_ASM_000342 /TAXON_ID=268821 /ORGANISM="Scrippsiella Hangoei, Strain SHTV-5" /LENGTH=114 /DNA_ID=CAMNT_0051016619 /DNA_START=203 /DNA_END=547 /DNA_ORIENTATION=-
MRSLRVLLPAATQHTAKNDEVEDALHRAHQAQHHQADCGHLFARVSKHVPYYVGADASVQGTENGLARDLNDHGHQKQNEQAPPPLGVVLPDMSGDKLPFEPISGSAQGYNHGK